MQCAHVGAPTTREHVFPTAGPLFIISSSPLCIRGQCPGIVLQGSLHHPNSRGSVVCIVLLVSFMMEKANFPHLRPVENPAEVGNSTLETWFLLATMLALFDAQTLIRAHWGRVLDLGRISRRQVCTSQLLSVTADFCHFTSDTHQNMRRRFHTRMSPQERSFPLVTEIMLKAEVNLLSHSSSSGVCVWLSHSHIRTLCCAEQLFQNQSWH